ncbi:MAG: ABC transporter permease subunit [Lapillicoccus sp.]
MTIPVQVIMVPLFKTVTTMGIYASYWAVILPTAASAFGIFLTRQFILAIPRELLEAARIDGAGQLRIFLRIFLRIVVPSASRWSPCSSS